MSAPPADAVDITALAAEGATVERRYGLGEFPRLADLLVTTGGKAVAQFRFLQLPAAAVAGCELQVTTAATLRCERCLAPFVKELDGFARLAFVAAGADSDALPQGFEELPLPPGRVSLRELVEDELLLALPVVALHGEDSDCARRARYEQGSGPDPGTGTQRPFAGLKELLKD